MHVAVRIACRDRAQSKRIRKNVRVVHRQMRSFNASQQYRAVLAFWIQVHAQNVIIFIFTDRYN